MMPASCRKAARQEGRRQIGKLALYDVQIVGLVCMLWGGGQKLRRVGIEAYSANTFRNWGAAFATSSSRISGDGNPVFPSRTIRVELALDRAAAGTVRQQDLRQNIAQGAAMSKLKSCNLFQWAR
jgi:hypothetical protein